MTKDAVENRQTKIKKITDRDIERTFSKTKTYHALDKNARQSLREKLQSALYHFVIAQSSRTPKETATADRLRKIVESLRRVAEFGTGALGDEADGSAEALALAGFDEIVFAADSWGRSKLEEGEELPSFFSLTAVDDGEYDFGTYSALMAFFRNAALVHKFVVSAEETLRMQPTVSRGTPLESLIGTELPEIYEQVVCEKYGATFNSETGFVGPGILFVKAALIVMGIKCAKTPSAIKEHRKNAKKRIAKENG